ncbi:MAG: HYR domain-containing protein, partial [Lewinella sp.]|nr:HYR domain-containing protein [Lewinella sp.]
MRAFILFCLLYLMTGGVFSKAFGQAEVTLKCNETLTIANLTYKDLIIPEGVDSIRIELRGADGGDAVKSGKSCGSRGHGGTGATVKATFAVGMDSGQLQAGGRLRVFVGQKGTSKLQDACLSLDNVAGGGGGSSAVLYLPPNADPLGVSWHMLGVAGAGGGAQWTIYGYGAGEEGKAEDEALGSAEEGDCGDSNLNGSEATYIYGGGGYRCFDPPANGVGGSMVLEVDGIRRVRLRTNTEALNTGGQSGVNGGDGFTGGGASAGLLASPGGGGGFSGGNSAEGGTSYLTEQFAVANSVKTDGVYRGGQERNGEVSIRTYANAATTAVCQDINLQPDANGDYVITPSDIDGGSLAECNLPITLTFLDGDLVKILDCTQLVQTLSLVVSSSTGQSDNCSATVTLVDNQPPTLTCQNPVIALNKEGNAVLTTSDVSSTISDNCGVKTLSLSRTNFDCSDLGTTTGLSLSAEDYHGNINTCTFNVTVVDELPPIPIAPLDTIFFNCTGSLGNNPPIAFDNCSGTVTGTTSDALTFSAPGVYPINWSFDDGNGNTSIVTEIVVVELNTIYVDQDAPPGGDGSSWATAFKDVDQAMDFLSVTCGDYYPEIWVAEGVYYPVDQVPDPATPDYDPRSKTFYLGRNGLKLYGGFNGTETRRSQRDPDQYVTILDGDIGVQGDASDNAYHIFYMDGASTAGVLITSTIIDGFTIRNGNANGAISSGGAMYIDGTTLNAPRPIIENCRFIANSGTFGGAVYLSGVGSEVRPEFRHCTFSQNTAVVVGAAIYSNGQAGIAAPIIQDCIFEQNTAGSTAGAIYFDEDDEGINPEETSGTVINCRFDQNSPSHIGFDDGYLGSEPVLINCTFTGAAVRAVQIDFWDTGQRPMFFYNCIFWDNNELTDNPAGMSIQNSITGNDTTFAGNNNNFNLDPLFADPTNGDFGLTDVSPALNVGNNVYVTNVSTDLAGQPRIKQGIVDLGAYEYQYAPGPIIYVDKSAVSGNNTGVSWASAFLDLQDAIDAFKATENTQIWVAAGTYYPTQEYDADNSGGSDSRERTFYFNKDGIKMYGGFAGTETLLAQRDPALNPTVLSGDIGTPGDSTDNAYHVLWLDGTAISITDSTLLDGFTIQGGMADGRALHRLGGGVYLNAFGGTVNPRIMNCNLVNNYALSGGAALFADASSGKISSVWQDCVFKDNSSPANGAIYLLGEDGNLIPEFINGLFLNNGWSHITYDDGASGAPNFTNCTFAGVNSMAIQVDFFDSGLGLMKLSNCILWNNNQLTNNAAALYIQNSLTGDDGGADFTGVNGNIQLDPLFADYAAGDLSLEACSPAINIGLNKAIVGISTDLAGNARVVDGTVDAGAYEFQDIALSNQGSGIVYVDINANGNNDGSDWGNAFTSLQDALTLTGACSQASEIWVAAGTYLPTQEFDADGSGGSDPREATFYINRDGIQLYGGFAGTEDARDQRAPAANTTILSGDIGNPGDSNDNAFHVLLIDGSSGAITANTVVDGFTITAGLADGSLANNSGSGVYLKGGISNDPLFSNCRFTANTAGGAIYLSGNTGQIAPAFFNCLFTSSGNAHIRYDDGLTGAPAFTNCTFWGASALAVDIESFDSGMIPLTFANCILWNNNLLTNNLSAIGIQNSIVGDDNSDSFAGSNGNIDQDPLFTAALNGNFQLEVCSPAIDLGDNSALGNLGTDLGGNLRIVNNTVDAGAYEAQTTSFDQAYPVIYV